MDFNSVQNPKKLIKIWVLVFILMGTFVSLILLIAGTLGFVKDAPALRWLTGNNTQLLPVFPGSYSTIKDGEHMWTIHEMQPVFESINIEGDSAFLVVSYELKRGEKKTVKIFLTGPTNPGLVSQTLYGTSKESAYVDPTALMGKLVVGQQIRVGYVAAVPAKEVRSVEFCTLDPVLCNLSNLFDSNSMKVQSFDKRRLITDSLVLPGYYIFTDLIDPNSLDINNVVNVEDNAPEN